jgi:T5orf172 domain
MSRFDKREMPEGYIYAFKVKDPQGRDYVKVGVTHDFKRRMKIHEKCYGECERIYPPEGENTLTVWNA